MLIGHYAPALVLKRVRPEVPLWLLFVGVQLVDYGWAAFVSGGLEHAHIEPGHTASNPLSLDYMPYSHGLLATFVWAAAFGAIGGAWLKSRGAGLALAASVVSHWLLDLPMH